MAKKIYITSNHGYNGWLRDCKAMVDLRNGGLVLNLTQNIVGGIRLDDTDAEAVMSRLKYAGISADTINSWKEVENENRSAVIGSFNS